MTHFARATAVLFTAMALPCLGQTNLLRNPGYEYGLTNASWTNISEWISQEDYGGVLRGLDAGEAHGGSNVLQMYAFGVNDHALHQDWTVTPGRVYSTEAWMRTVPGTNYFTPTNGFVFVSMDFLNAASGTIVSIGTPPFKQNGPTNWTLYRTQPALAPSNAAIGRTYCLYVYNGDSTAQGAVYIDDAVVATTMPSVAGAVLNPGFEDNPIATTYSDIPFWTALGNAFGTESNVYRSGAHALQVYFTENLVGQFWPATQGVKYATAAWLFQTSSVPFVGLTGEHGLVALEFYDVATNLLIAYNSADFLPQSPTNQWLYHEARGTAPNGTVFGRTLCGIVGGTGVGMSGSVYFDDVTQQVVSTTGTVAGLLHNGGFDDGPTGNANALDPAGDLPGWDWLGGGSAGFVTREVQTNEEQSFVITFTENLAQQYFPVAAGGTYVFEGYLYTPWPTNTLQGTAYGVLIAQVLDGTDIVASAESSHFVAGSPTNAWVKRAAAVEAPASGTLTGRVMVAILGSPVDYDGSIFFDGMRVDPSGPLTEFQKWQVRYFAATNGPGVTANEDYDHDGQNNITEFVAGTGPDSTGSVLKAAATSLSAVGVQVVWPSVAGRVYELWRLSNLTAGTESMLATGIVATPPLNTYTDSVPLNPVNIYKLKAGTP